MAKRQNDRISAVELARDKFAGDKKTVDTLVAQLRAQDATLGAKKADIQSRLDGLQKLRLTAYGAGGTPGGKRQPAGRPIAGYRRPG